MRAGNAGSGFPESQRARIMAVKSALNCGCARLAIIQHRTLVTHVTLAIVSTHRRCGLNLHARHDRVPNTCHDTRHYRTLVTARALVLRPRFSMTLAQVDRRDTRARVTALEPPSAVFVS
jgi:hypothetical protein